MFVTYMLSGTSSLEVWGNLPLSSKSLKGAKDGLLREDILLFFPLEEIIDVELSLILGLNMRDPCPLSLF
jgi:hypothetical protein